MSSLHKKTRRDYLARVNDPEYPKAKAARIAKEFGREYWDGDRRICYGGYTYQEGRWSEVAEKLASHYKLKEGSKVLDIGCGKGYLLYDLTKAVEGLEVYGIDISDYAIAHSKEEIRNRLVVGCATSLPWEDNLFDLVVSTTTLHNLECFNLEKAIKEMVRVSKKDMYLCVESYRDEEEKANLLYWQVTCEAFNSPSEWLWWFEKCSYEGDYSFLFFE